MTDLRTLCTRESPCDVCRDWLPEAWEALDKALKQEQKHKAAAAAKRVHNSMDDSIELHALEEGLQAPPVKKIIDGSTQQQHDSVGKDKTATSSKTSKATDSQPSRSHDKPHDKSSKTVSSSVSVVDRSSRSDGPSGTKGSDRHSSHSDELGHRNHHRGSSRHHESPRACHSPRRHESGERTRPSSSAGRSSSRSKHGVDSMAHPGSTRAVVKATDSRPSSSHHHHHPRATVDHRSLPSPSRATVNHWSLPEQHHHRRHEKDSTDHLGSTHVSRREIDLTTAVPEQPEKRTITVFQSPARPASDDDSAEVTGPAEAADSAGEDSARQAYSAVVADPTEDDDSAGVADPAEDADSAGDAHPAEQEDSAAVDSAGGADSARQKVPAVTTPARSQTPSQQGRDSKFASEDGSSIFPSLPRQINQASLLDFMSMMTLM